MNASYGEKGGAVFLKNWRRFRGFCFKNKAYILAAFLPAALLFGSYMLFGVYPAGKNSVLALDLNAQYVYYYEYMYDVFAGKESFFYCWSRTFSGEFFGIFAYYLASPFNFIVWLFPRTMITEGLLAMLVCKAAAGGFICAVFLKKHRGFSDLTTVLFSLMYALSGYFAAHSINPMWLDGMMFLPLVLMGVEYICDRKRFLLYAVSLAYVFISNYYIGYMVGIFSALYFVYHIASGRIKDGGAKSVGKSVLIYGLSSVAAISMSAWLIIPAYKSLQMGKLDFGDEDFSLAENFNLSDILIKLFPGTFDTIRPEGFPMLYCGTLALIFAVIWFTMRNIPLRQRVSGGVLLGIMLLSMYIKPVDMLWHGGAVPIWMPYRYAFIAAFLMVMFGAEAFENIRSVKRKSIGAVFAALLGVLLIVDHYEGSDNFDTTLIIVIPLIVLSVIAGAAAFYKKYHAHRAIKVTLLALVCAELVMNNLVTFHTMDDDIVYSTRENYLGDIPATREVVNEVKAQDDGFYRMEKTYHRCVNDPMAAGMYGMSHSTSTFNAKAIALAKTLGFGAREHYSRYDGATPLTDDILGVKYVLSERALLSQYKKIVNASNDSGINAYKNDDAFGWAYLAEKSVIGGKLDNKSPFASQERLAAQLSGKPQSIFLPVDDYAADFINVNAGSTTDGHLSYKKRLENDDAFITYRITAPRNGRFYMYLPSLYERECELYVNDEFIKYYFENENHSIAYLGEFLNGETFEVKLKLLGSEVFYEHPLFRVLDDEALERFDEQMLSMNAQTEVKRVGAAELAISVNAEKDCAMFTSIPYEEGWTVTLDGVPVPILKCANDTFMCFEVPKGEHVIEMSFKTAGLKTGVIVSICGTVLFAALIVISVILRKKQSGEKNDITAD